MVCKQQVDSRGIFEVESQKGQLVRGDLARTVVESGWDLNELRPEAMSLEEIFLQLTGSQPSAEGQKEGQKPEQKEGEKVAVQESHQLEMRG